MRALFYILIIFFVVHLFIVLGINQIPIFQLDFPFKSIVEVYEPKILSPLAGFDGAHYIMIAKFGYQQYQEAFFPLYPVLVNLLPIFNPLVSGLLISWLSLIAGSYFFYRITNLILKRKNDYWSLIFLLSFPSAFFFITVYSESLFLATASLALFFIFKRNFKPAALFCILASLTKLQGFFLIIPFLFSVFEAKKGNKLFNILIALSPILGLAAYSIFLFFRTGDPLYFYHSQEAFGANRISTGFVFLPQVFFRYLKILITADLNFQYWIAFLELSVFLIVFAVLLWVLYLNFKKKDFSFEFSLNLYSLAALMLPTLTGTLSSIPRYSLIAYGFFIALSKIRNVSLKILIGLIFSILHLVLFFYFIKGYFVS
ncbi:MAG: hypothetical protein A3C27_01020 [Candidatus Levybacteria bacterium RIFCSPHIGHO2_02_FULL_39_36]|nr:MAG: hypothetical protein UT56_C0003G0024 [Candidatus Levybacteria bacterium GW2011_GWB1_39_7]OGH15528.1 MAG: hypothetical protein A2689_03040 [Candidatus Levybacteria bacterium RIFCSPHIGHO2_01_FULL_38_96]OGH25438.1 MAG: hypothetical protein A3E68_01015 [Candidatus Levybacteria bacterium RIFCSPHIGHO2_12_FULL_39_39]OGH28395.1 MAG: hypothetical protein A3C27_01020 [Candidatus Levybacteria bacterium RIFCSPHIGHO2_02_FULL_39_36]OGH35933.1 MAG: hypothetical protein A3B43_00370 [Candidatus Levybact